MFRASATALRLWWQTVSDDILGADLAETVAEDLGWDAAESPLEPEPSPEHQPVSQPGPSPEHQPVFQPEPLPEHQPVSQPERFPSPALALFLPSQEMPAEQPLSSSGWEVHPHRRPLRHQRIRRDGAVPVRPQFCLCPIATQSSAGDGTAQANRSRDPAEVQP